jgi:hypothetical protein
VGHHLPLGWQPVTVAELAGGDLGAELRDDLHVQGDWPVQLGGPVTHLLSIQRTASASICAAASLEVHIRLVTARSGSSSLLAPPGQTLQLNGGIT